MFSMQRVLSSPVFLGSLLPGLKSSRVVDYDMEQGKQNICSLSRLKEVLWWMVPCLGFLEFLRMD